MTLVTYGLILSCQTERAIRILDIIAKHTRIYRTQDLPNISNDDNHSVVKYFTFPHLSVKKVHIIHSINIHNSKSTKHVTILLQRSVYS